ncbi:hypothetical protein BpHYR1_002721 [Brachionus plicatilis]|uniref:Uncharacterized protein n=1 Tax=Brachionus plicatilis TaxID=10195 RepID=A0A3M7QB18_BRAPC|nr:hypothetical protein BpHYR1_002721 [Brachionus plicatilis]
MAEKLIRDKITQFFNKLSFTISKITLQLYTQDKELCQCFILITSHKTHQAYAQAHYLCQT